MNSSAGSDKTGSLESRYRLIRELGRGGFGHSYLAEDRSRYNELCVLKEFVPQLEDKALIAKAQELFGREAGVLYQLDHAQIPKFRELLRVREQSGKWRLFLVQDYIEGTTYQTLLQTRRRNGSHFSESEVTELLYQLLPVLTYIHSKGIIHRDISPDNLILNVADGLPVLIDFGGVKQLSLSVQQQLAASSPPAETTRIGKVGYVPPEQLQSGSADATSDLYGLAATLLVLTTGKDPQELFDAYHGVWNWSDEVLSPELSCILERMLAARPADRFPSAEAVSRALAESNISRNGQLPGLSQPNLNSTDSLDLDPGDTVAMAPPPPVPEEYEELSPAAAAPTPGLRNGPLPDWWQVILGLVMLVGTAGVVLWLALGGIRLPNVFDSADQEETFESTAAFSQEELNRRSQIASRRQRLGIDEGYFNQLVDQFFVSRYPELRDRTLTDSPEDAPLRLRWDNLAAELLDLLERNLSARALTELGGYGAGNRDRWQSRLNALNLSSRALNDLADGKFFDLFPRQVGQDFLNEPIGQIWYGLAADRVRQLEDGERLETISFSEGAFSQRLSGQLNPGEGKVFTLQLNEGQILRLNLQAPAGSTLISLYLPSPTEETPYLLADSTQTTWSERLTQSGIYEITVVSTATEAISYQLNIAVDNVTSDPSPEAPEEFLEDPQPEAPESNPPEDPLEDSAEPPAENSAPEGDDGALQF